MHTTVGTSQIANSHLREFSELAAFLGSVMLTLSAKKEELSIYALLFLA
jgi:hypothetical protein